ncbi:peptide chain release factor N(5)-glutamine methyltransferase [Mariniluteicoccus endophyticus]
MSLDPVPTSEALREAGFVLDGAGVPSPVNDARLLLSHTLGVEPGRLVLVDSVEPKAYATFLRHIEARATGLPLQHITGEAWFRNIRVEVGPGVFVPRPETEVMTGWAIDRLRETDLAHPRVVELCAGSGAISLSLVDEVPGVEVHAVEVDHDAADWCERNLVGSGVSLTVADMAEALHDLDGTVDLVIANPPYIPLDMYEGVPEEVRVHDPAVALFSGPDGLDAMRVVARAGARLLRRGGLICAEHAEVQAESAPTVFVDEGDWTHVRDHVDLNERPRFVTAVRR